MISINTKKVRSSRTYPRLEDVTAPTVSTEQAAYYLNRASQTLRIWAMGKVSPPIKPLRIGGRLAWPTEKLRTLFNVDIKDRSKEVNS